MSRKPKQLLSEEDVIRLRDQSKPPVPRPVRKFVKKAKAVVDGKLNELRTQIVRYQTWQAQLTKRGASEEWYERKMMEQGRVCAICGQAERAKCNRGDGSVRRLAGDHNHKTGEMRGLLCNFCNTQLGALENAEWRAKAEEYLDQYQSVSIT